MSAAEALKVARSFGIRLVVNGDDLVLKGSAPPPPRVFDLLRRHKPEIMLLIFLGIIGALRRRLLVQSARCCRYPS